MSKSRILDSEQLTWYEFNLPLLERKQRGHFSTPPQLVASILDACGYTPDNDLAQVRVLDPACGSGNFLVEAAQRLQTFSIQAGLSPKVSARLFKRNLWGIDPDPISCFLAEMHVQNVIHSRASRRIPFTSLHIHQADSLVLPWEPVVDLFIANPPYLAAKNNDLSGYQFVHRRGQADSYLLFLNLALQVVRPGGWIGLVLPDPLLVRANAARERERLLKETTIYHLWHFSEVFAAEVGAVVIVARKTPPKSLHFISWKRGRWHSKLSSHSHDHVQQSLFARQPGAEFRYLLSNDRGDAIERLRTSLVETPAIERRLAPLGEFLTISRGEELGKESYYLQEKPSQFHTSASVASKQLEKVPIIDSLASLTATLPVLRGGIDIHPYTPPVANHHIALKAIRKPPERYLSPKLLVVKSTDRLQATLDLQGNVTLQTLYLLHLRNYHANVDQLYFYMALLNSLLLREYVYILHTAYKMVQPQIEQRVLASLPVPLVKAQAQQAIIERSRALVHACSGSGPVVEWNEHITALYEEQERDICALYDSALAGALLTKES
ncbi:MAG TPA: N-6 DNA methylase [Ktedonobacteraceae bacterium]|nr:N-6 DNA methylase [Ktedonobacteraceae bacterium]